jgi:hypothetical protein
MQYVQTVIYSQVDKTLLQARIGSTACSTEYGAVYAHNASILESAFCVLLLWIDQRSAGGGQAEERLRLTVAGGREACR